MNAIEIENKYHVEVADFASYDHKLLMITINKSISERNVYNAVRFAWRADLARAKRADYVLAVQQGIIKGVFIAEQWKEATVDNFPLLEEDIKNRIGFVGKEASDDIKDIYMRKRLPNKYTRRGASNPIKYNYK